jgi:hypothetical protein
MVGVESVFTLIKIIDALLMAVILPSVGLATAQGWDRALAMGVGYDPRR